MKVYVFTAPTLSAGEARAELDAVYLPPARQGDVYRAAREGPFAIGLIDGYFDRVPSVTHKELLWALAQGIHVLGAASLGALRAVELAPFGMEGVGEVFQAFQSGALEDDDEVAVTHAPAEEGYRPLSEAMVNIRATLRAAEAAGVMGSSTRAGLERVGKALFYPDRSYPLLLERGAQEGLPAAELDALRAWLPAGRRDAKREDARALLRAVRERVAANPGPRPVTFHFHVTDAWTAVRDRALRTGPPGEASIPSWRPNSANP